MAKRKFKSILRTGRIVGSETKLKISRTLKQTLAPKKWARQVAKRLELSRRIRGKLKVVRTSIRNSYRGYR